MTLRNQKRLALLILDHDVPPGSHAKDLVAAFRECPVWEEGVIDKVHVSWHSDFRGFHDIPGEAWADRWVPTFPTKLAAEPVSHSVQEDSVRGVK